MPEAHASSHPERRSFTAEKPGKDKLIDCSPPEGLLTIYNYVMQYFQMTGKQMPRAGNYIMLYPIQLMSNARMATLLYRASPIRTGQLCARSWNDRLKERFPNLRERSNPEKFSPGFTQIENFTTHTHPTNPCASHPHTATSPTVKGRRDGQARDA